VAVRRHSLAAANNTTTAVENSVDQPFERDCFLTVSFAMFAGDRAFGLKLIRKSAWGNAMSAQIRRQRFD
jgi:hypothetical protein